MAGRGVAAPELELDLGEEARAFLRTRIPVTATGLGIGSAFIGIGGYLVGPLARTGPLADEVLAILLIVLGIGLILLSLRTGLINPVIALRADARGFTYQYRWGAPTTRRWSRVGLVLVLDDLGADPRSTAEARRHVFFAGPGSVYGNLPAQSVGPLLDLVRGHDLSVAMHEVDERRGRAVHRIRRIRISRPPGP
ncbi:MAG TPA: hypothetical protein VEL82_05945 [Thermoplasmata archaeon]|nr:hypothetical protein [Thermoplasmata archaeon]